MKWTPRKTTLIRKQFVEWIKLPSTQESLPGKFCHFSTLQCVHGLRLGNTQYFLVSDMVYMNVIIESHGTDTAVQNL